MKRITKTAAALALAAGVVAVSGSPASADVPGLEIGEIGYNAYGADQAWNRNAEFVDIKNTSNEGLNVKGLRVEDAWAHGRGSGAGKCNNFTVTELPGVTETDGKVLLPAGHVVRVYVGSGEAKVFGPDLRWHAVYANSDTRCGYNGHFLNNGAQKDRSAPWETVWVTLGSVSESKSYNFSYGYRVQ